MDYLGGYNGINAYNHPRVIFKGGTEAGIVTKPVQTVENVINNTVDTFVKPEKDEEKRKSRKIAIAAGSSAIVLTALVALCNPKVSNKLITKLKTMSGKAAIKAKENSTAGRLYGAGQRFLSASAKCLEFTNNINSVKDRAFTWLCVEQKTYGGIKNDKIRKGLISFDNVFRKITKKPHELITAGFDAISKHTVCRKYQRALKKLNNFEKLAAEYKEKLPAREKTEIENLLVDIAKTKEYFSKQAATVRLGEQEKIMSNLDQKVSQKFKEYVDGFRNKSTNKTEHIKKNMYFWAEDILKPQRSKIEQDGTKIVDTLLGDGRTQRGKYNEIIDKLSPYMTKEEKIILEKSIQKGGESLRKANRSECTEYFDKKRDLILGSAPTDILSAAFWIGASGIAIGTADTKEQRVSKALTLAFPAIAGVGASMVLTAMLFSGVQGLAAGFLTSIGLSKIGSTADKYLNPKRDILSA